MAENKGREDKEKKSVPITPSEIFKVSMRTPPFWPEEPEIWFAQVEGQFAISGITNDTTKFHHIIGQLDQQFSKEVKDIIICPPATDKYEKLKTELIKRLSASNEKKVHQLLMHEELGDRKPSQFMRHLRGLAGPQVPNDFLKTIWTSRLPGNIQTVLAAQPNASLEVLADLADRIHDIVPSVPQVAYTSHNQAGTSNDALVKEIASLRKQLNTLTTKNQQQQSHPRGRKQQRDRSRTPTTRSQSNYRKFPQCWYHYKFGEEAKKCIRPCDYKSENFMGGR